MQPEGKAIDSKKRQGSPQKAGEPEGCQFISQKGEESLSQEDVERKPWWVGIPFGYMKIMDGSKELPLVPFEDAPWVTEKGKEKDGKQTQEKGGSSPLPLDPGPSLVHHWDFPEPLPDRDEAKYEHAKETHSCSPFPIPFCSIVPSPKPDAANVCLGKGLSPSKNP